VEAAIPVRGDLEALSSGLAILGLRAALSRFVFTVSSPRFWRAWDSIQRKEGRMRRRRILAAVAAASIAGAIWLPVVSNAGGSSAGSSTTSSACSGYEPVLDPNNFVGVIDNRYFPLPVGRTLTYRGVKDGETQIDRVTVTPDTKVLEGITARVISDVATHRGKLLEKTFDWYAQDKQGNVWYLGENTTAYLPNGHKDKSGSWKAGVNDAEPGIIMEAHPQIPDAYRQECLAGQAEDTAWVVGTSGSITVPYGTAHNVLTSLEATRIEPGLVDKKVYAPGIGIALERAITGSPEVAKLVKVTG
jgi:hypothetical protein